MKKEHVIKVSGKDYVTYDGLITEAHERGLLVLEVEMIQSPSPENGHTAVCRATASVKVKGATDGSFVTCTDVGDASPDNVGAKIVPHIIRMASTRAKNRALSDAMGITGASAEELITPESEPAAPEALITKIKNGLDYLGRAYPAGLADLTLSEGVALLEIVKRDAQAKVEADKAAADAPAPAAKPAKAAKAA